MTNRDYIWYVVDFAKRVLNSGIVLSFRKRHPAAYDFIYNRITLSRFSGLPLSILGIAIFSNLFYIILVVFAFDKAFSLPANNVTATRKPGVCTLEVPYVTF